MDLDIGRSFQQGRKRKTITNTLHVILQIPKYTTSLCLSLLEQSPKGSHQGYMKLRVRLKLSHKQSRPTQLNQVVNEWPANWRARVRKLKTRLS